MRANERILRHLLRILLVAQELVNHRINAVPVTGNHLVESGLITALKPIH